MTEQTTTRDPAPAEVGRCGQTFRGIMINRERPTAVCDLLSGHPGWHRDRTTGMEWGAVGCEHLDGPYRHLPDERDELRAELARVRPVVDAARAFFGEHPRSLDKRKRFAALEKAVAALDGDAAATPAPPVDVAAQLRAAAKAGNHVRCQTTSDPFAYVQLIDSADMLGHFLATNPDDPVAQAIARALTATPTETERPSDA